MGMAVHHLKKASESPPCRYGLGRSVSEDFTVVAQRLISGLETNGFEIVFRLDYADKFQAAGAGPFPPYQIWGVSHLDRMHRAVIAEPTVGLLFPWHMILFGDTSGETVVMVMDPTRIMDLLRHPAAIEAAIDIGEMLEHLVDEL